MKKFKKKDVVSYPNVSPQLKRVVVATYGRYVWIRNLDSDLTQIPFTVPATELVRYKGE
jgi:hypothetical protein